VGLRSSVDGNAGGLAVTIFGGDHGDIAITPAMGELVADYLIDERLSAVLDLGPFRKGEQIMFWTAFAERLYHRNRSAMHLVVDEADAYCPQRVGPEMARSVGALADIVRRGRIRGIGVTLITQRPDVLNKNVLTQLDTLIVLQMTAPQDRKAILEWVQENADPGEAERMIRSLASLKKGEAWVWSPAALGIFERVQIRRRRTFDSSATPKVGQRIVEPRVLADVEK
jgi:DNA helicase HerA-like ATPase